MRQMHPVRVAIVASLGLLFLSLIGCEKAPSPPAAAQGSAQAAAAERSEAYLTMLQVAREFGFRMSSELAHNPQFNTAFRKLIELKRPSDPKISTEAWRTMIAIQDFCPGPDFTADQWTKWVEGIEATGVGSHTRGG